jgi:hypothetical protein
MPDLRQPPPLMRPGEIGVELFERVCRLHAVGVALQDDCRHADPWLRGELGFDRLQRRIARRIAIAMPVGLDRDRDEIRIVERNGAPFERRVVEGPMRRL